MIKIPTYQRAAFFSQFSRILYTSWLETACTEEEQLRCLKGTEYSPFQPP